MLISLLKQFVDMAELQQDPVFQGLTRATTMYGVQYEAFILYFMLASVIFLIMKNPLYLLLVLPFHGLCYLASLKDERIFSLLMLKLQSLGYCRNRAFWKSNSYSPWGEQ